MTELAGVRDASSLPEALAARVRRELSMPFLPTVFTMLSKHRRYLCGAVDAFMAAPKPIDDHARACRLIGAEAAMAMVTTRLALGSAAPRIGVLIDLYNRVNPPSLLFTLFLAAGETPPPLVMAPPLPSPPADSGVEAMLADLCACHSGSRLPGFWRELVAGWPERAAAAAWALVRRLPADERFAGAVGAIAAATREALGGRLAPSPLELGCTSAQALEISNVVASYALVISTMTVEIECLRWAAALGSPAKRPSVARQTG